MREDQPRHAPQTFYSGASRIRLNPSLRNPVASRTFLFLALLLLALPASAGVWAHYSFDTDYADVSGNAQHGELTDVGTTGNSGITSASGNVKFGSGAMNFSADRDFIAIPSKTFASGSPYTIAFWAKKAPGDTGDAATWDMVIGQRDNANFFIALSDANGTGLRWRGSSSATERQADFAAIMDYQWHHYAIVASGTTITCYQDGVACGVATDKQTGFILDAIGEAYAATNDYDFNGQLDEVWVFDEALGANAIKGLFQSNDPSASPPPVTKVRIILQGGQSNSDGRAAVSGLPAELQAPQADVDLYYRVEGGAGTLTSLRPGLSETSQFGPEITLGRRLANLYAQEAGTRVAIIKYANGGTNLYSQWKAGGNATTTNDGPEYITFQQTVTSGLNALAAKYPQAVLELDSMVWMQGESDAVATQAANYQTNLTNFITDIRLTCGTSLPFIIGRLSSKQTSLNASYLNQVRAAQDAVAAADHRTSVISTDDFGMNGDNLHFSASGQQSLGSAFAEDVAYNTWMIETFPAGDIDAGNAEPNADPDGDGQTNRQEFLGVANPTSGSSKFQASFMRTGAASGSISYSSSSSRWYAVERWIEATGQWGITLPYAPGQEMMTTRILNSSSAREIYRVISRLP